MPPDEIAQPSQEPTQVVPAPEQAAPDGAAAVETPADGEATTPEVTLESLQAEREALAAEKTRLEGELQAKERVLSAKDKANARLTSERDGALSEVAKIRSHSDTEQRRLELLAAQDDPDKADALVRKQLHDIDNPPPAETPEQRELRLTQSVKKQAYESHKTRLGITAEEEQQAFAIATAWAAEDGRETPEYDEGITACSVIAARRLAGPASAELTAAQEKLKQAEEELEALRGDDAGARMRSNGGPEDRVPSGGSGKAYKTEAELRMARANKEITLDEFKRELPKFQPVARRI